MSRRDRAANTRPAATSRHHLVSHPLLLVAQPIHVRLLCLVVFPSLLHVVHLASILFYVIISLSRTCLAVPTSRRDISSCLAVAASRLVNVSLAMSARYALSAPVLFHFILSRVICFSLHGRFNSANY